MTDSREDGANGRDPEGADAASALGEDDEGLALLPLLDAEMGPARPLAERELLLLADRIERQFLQRQRPPSRLTPRRLWLAGGLFAASAAAAVVGVSRVQRSAQPVPVTSPAESRDPTTAPPELPSAAEPGVVAPPPGPAGPGLPGGSVLPGGPVSPATGERPAESGSPREPAGVPKPSDSPRLSPEGSAEPALHAPRNGAAAARPSVLPRREDRSGNQNGTVAADRLAAANGLRSRHRYREALALYLQVIEMAPNGIQASVARVAAAEMQLEHFGDVAGAERLYREAKTQGGELTTEAQFGLAQVARARADAPGERRALQDFLSRHPESPLAAAARRRLNTLGDK